MALNTAGIVLSLANSIFESFYWQTYLIRRENVAVQAEAIAENWFIKRIKEGSQVYSSDFELPSEANEKPLLDMPDDLLSELKHLNDQVEIDVMIADQNYGTGFKNTASTLGIPLGRTSEINIFEGECSSDLYGVKRFQIITKIKNLQGQEKPFTLSKNILVLRDIYGGYQIITLYTKKL